MAAPAGYRTWSTADLVSASDFSTYIQDQVVGVYTSTSNRSSELASPAEGQVSFLTDSNVFSIYNGSAWVDVLDVDTISVSSGNYAMTGTLTLNSGSDTFSFPADRGSATNVLQSDGDGTTSWVAATTGDLTGLTAGTNIDITSATGPVPTITLAIDAALATGADGSGVDVTFHSDTAGDYLLWDSSEEKLILEGTNGATVLDVTDGNVVIGDGTLTVGSDGAGEDVTFHSDTAGDSFLWDSSEEKLILEGTNGATVLDITDGNVVIGDGTLTVGSDGAGEDVTFHSDTAGDAFVWDSSAEKLTITGTDGQTALDVPDGNVTITDTLTVSGGLVAPLAINAQTGTTYTFVLADAGKLVTSSNGSAQTFTVPPNSSVAYAVGTQIIVQNIGSANCTLAQGSGVTINSKDSNKEIDGQYAAATLIKTATDAWSLIGALT